MASRTVFQVLSGLMCLAILEPGAVLAMRDKDNQGTWEKPTENNTPDKEVPGFLVNLGPTGARAILTDNTFIVRYVFKDAPALNKLKIGDVITGAFGKPFGVHTFGGSPHGYEGPIMDFGEAIERAEGKDGKLILNVQRGSEKTDVTINLEAIGTFSATFPFNCRKSELIRARALKYLAEHPDALNVWQSHARMAVTLALLTSDDSSQFSAGKGMVLKWSGQSPDDKTWTWNLSHQLITLSEYYQLTKDTSVLPMMKIVVGALDKAQYAGKIVVWKAKENEDPAKIDAAQQLYDGGFGHAPYVPGVGKDGGFGPNGYGPMQYTTILAVIAWQEAGRCGVQVHQDNIKRALDFIHRGTNAGGYVGYGGEFTLNNGLVDPVSWKKGQGGDNYVGRSGCSLVAHKLSPESPESIDYIDLNQRYLERAYKSLPDGHADSNLGIFWGVLGAAASGDDKALRPVLDYHKAFFNMMRCHDGSFVLLPGRDYADNGYYMASRYHPTATMALIYGLSSPKLQVQGIMVSIPGVNPKALKGRMDTAYRALVKKAYAEAASALSNPAAADVSVATAMTGYLDAQAAAAVEKLEALEKEGDLYELNRQFKALRAQFGPLESFASRTNRYEEALRTDEWKMQIGLGANYHQLVDALQRNKTAAYAGDLERFAERHPESIYAKKALAVASAFREGSGVKEAPADTSAPATPIARPEVPVKKPAVSPEVLAEWQTRLVKKIDSLGKSGSKVMLYMGDQGQYAVRGADETSLIVEVQGNRLPMPWKQISLGYRASLAKDASKDGDAESLLIAAVLHVACGKEDQADELFAKASLVDAEATKVVRDALSGHH